ncbi:MAG: hypothetical protein HOP18_00050 [Deltaproteobacteria bacterium]|nr:hypothetical protein [Deltaproteobacteria bacterium]
MATLFSCVTHILALGFAAGVELAAACRPVSIVAGVSRQAMHERSTVRLL